MLKLENGETTFQAIEPGSTKDLQLYLAEIGARLADVFGADNVLWVEGRTEELCFPRILQDVAHQGLMGTVMVGLKRTGDLEGRDAERALEIYDQLAHANSLAPPALAFILDSECRTDQEKRELMTRSGDRLRFLPRRMYENYLLHATAVANIVNAIPGFRAESVTPAEVQGIIDQKLRDRTYFYAPRPGGPQQQHKSWVDAVRILNEIFVGLSETRFSYEKVKHGVALTEWLIENAPQELAEISGMLAEILRPQNPHQ